ncbi:type II toxin-antitoxin system HicB family antitoxin [Prosthecomicrobium pneumaticum]|uniref:Putative RNase H-like HicB family nuclease n=1 Tax=Prosthecomicrobium pneumaticum TaxID=81895 RepID=A0A7W9FMB5_9HYPH|nr:type II toxin-antitoxin system HicB family antitoxin [Prosthecomicrobium pneumaticum]MBB5753317.1 putative RNase H-like HicB family nuclease [Prosthecomicrobium pneumaticum]
MAKSIVALIHGEAGNYGISFPDVPGCISAGDTLDETIANGAEALAFHLEGMAEDGEAMPIPRTLDAIRADPEFAFEFSEPHIVTLLPYDPPGRTVRINITMDEHLVEAIDRAAKGQGGTRSGFLAALARERLGHR